MTEYLTPGEVVQMSPYSTSLTSIYRAIRAGQLPAKVKRGYKGRKGRYHIKSEDARRFFNEAYDVYTHNHFGE